MSETESTESEPLQSAPSIVRVDGEDVDFREWLRENRDRIEREAESEAPDAWVFERLLQWLDSDEEGGAS